MQNTPLTKGTLDTDKGIAIDGLARVSPVLGNPFPGLRPFTIEESHLFFGREGQVDEILSKLAKHHFVAIMGHSGSGKSSLMYCGLIPVLYGGFITDTTPDWNIIVVRPGYAPLHNLTEAVLEFLLQRGRILPEDRHIHRAIVLSILRNGPQGLIELSQYLRNGSQENIFFLIDQFEEIFRFRQEEDSLKIVDDADIFVNLVITAVSQREYPIYATITMRSDFLGNCSAFSGLTELINLSNYLVPQLTHEQRKLVIQGPVEVAGGKISQRLIRRLLGDIGNDQNQLPVLQHVLMRTWDNWVDSREPGEPMDLRHYNAVGKIEQALSLHANEVYDDLTQRQKEISEILFKNLTEKNQDNKGMRRPVRLGLVSTMTGASEKEVIEVVEHFRQSGRSFLMPGTNVRLNGDTFIELSHESLMRIWNRLNLWVEEEFDSAQMYKRLSEASAMYQIGKTGLWRPPDLQLALNWLRKQNPTREWADRYDKAFERAMVFLDTSRITYEAELKNQDLHQQRVLQRTRATAVILGLAAVLAILFFVFAYLQKLEADEQSRIAEVRRLDAVVQQKKADSLRVIADKESERAIYQQKIAEGFSQRLQKALDTLRVAQFRTQQALQLAEQEEKKALSASDNERVARIEAEKQTEIARREYERATQLYMLTKAQELATKSYQEDDDKDLAGLLAMQGFLFHQRYHGKKYDPYVYRGLYYALTKLSGVKYNAIKVPGTPRNKMASIVISGKNDYYVAGTDGRIFKGNMERQSCQTTEMANPYPNKMLALSHNGRYLINGTDSAFVQVYDLQSSAKKAKVITGFSGATNDMKFLPDDSGIIISSGGARGGKPMLSKVNHITGEMQLILDLPFELKSISLSPDGKTLAGGSWSGSVILVNLLDRTYTTLVSETNSRILTVKFSPDGHSLAYGTEDLVNNRGLVKLFAFETKEIRQFSGHRAGVYDVEFSPDGQLLASAGSDRRLQMWVLGNLNDLPIEMDNNTGFVWDIVFAEGSDYLIAACSDSEVRVWQTDPSKLAEQICPKVKRNLTSEEWNRYVGDEIKSEITCVQAEIKQF